MKKVLIFVVVLIIAVALIGPKIVGSQLQGGIQDTVDVINKNPNYTASITRLESTWFTTTAEVSLGLNLPDMSELTGQAPIDVSIDINLTSHHGPILSNDGFAIGLLHTVMQTKSTEIPEGIVLPSNKPFYQFNGITGLFGTTTYQDEVAGLSYTDASTGGTVVFSGLQGNGEISGSGITYQALADNVNMTIENAVNFDIQGLAIDFKSSESIAGILSKGLYDSNSSFSMDLITFNDLMQDIEVRVVDTKLVALSDYDKASDLGNVKAILTATSLNTTDISFTDLNTVIEFNNLQAEFLLAYQDFSSKMMNNMASPDKIENDLQAFMQEYLLAQLQANPEYNISTLSGKINGSPFEGKTMTKLSGVTAIPDPLDDSAFWMQHIVVDSKMMMQKGAAEFVAAQIISYQLSANADFMELGEEERAQIIQQQVPNMLVGLTQQGMIIAEGEEYTATFTMETGVVLLNGNPIPL